VGGWRLDLITQWCRFEGVLANDDFAAFATCPDLI